MKFFIGIIIASITGMLDQLTKSYVFALLQDKEANQIEILPFFNLVMVHNFGVSFGMFNSIPYSNWILSIVAVSITIVLLLWLWRAQQIYLSWAIGLIIGGAVGNIIDRVLYGAVADFLDFYIGKYHWPAFNLADTAVFIGVVMVLLESFFTGKGEKNV